MTHHKSKNTRQQRQLALESLDPRRVALPSAVQVDRRPGSSNPQAGSGVLKLQSLTIVLSLALVRVSLAESYEFRGFWETKHGKSHEVVGLGVLESQYQGAVNLHKSEGLELFQVDAYDVEGTAHMNFVFRTPTGRPWLARHGLTGAQYLAVFDKYVDGKNYRIRSLDSYRRGNSIRYAVVLTRHRPRATTAYHGLTPSQHQAKFDQRTADGWDPINVSVVSLNGSRFYTACYEKRAGTFALKSFLTRDEFAEHNIQQKEAGRELAYANAYTHDHNALPRFVAIWRSRTSAGPCVTNVYGPTAMEQGDELGPKGFYTRFVTGYGVGQGHRFDVKWYKPSRTVSGSRTGRAKKP